jgi:hypothetical protein
MTKKGLRSFYAFVFCCLGRHKKVRLPPKQRQFFIVTFISESHCPSPESGQVTTGQLEHGGTDAVQAGSPQAASAVCLLSFPWFSLFLLCFPSFASLCGRAGAPVFYFNFATGGL